MKTRGMLALLTIVALVATVTGANPRDGAWASPFSVIAFNPDVCSLTIAPKVGPREADRICLRGARGAGIQDPDNLAAVAEALGGAVGDPSTYRGLVDASAAQLGADGFLGASGQTLWVLVFVTNDLPLTFTTQQGVWFHADAAAEQCTYRDEDCDGDGVAGDGVVTDLLWSGRSGIPNRGVSQVTVEQGSAQEVMNYVVVGPPVALVISWSGLIQEESGSSCSNLADFAELIEKPDVSGLLAVVTDEDGTRLTGIRASWRSSVPYAVELGADTTVSVAGTIADAALNLGCGKNVGTSKVTATVHLGKGMTDSGEVTVIPGPDRILLNAGPPRLVCDGAANSLVSAVVRNDEGDVLEHNAVRFEVVGPGGVEPAVAKTDAGGYAATRLTPTSGTTGSVVVRAIVERASPDAGHPPTIEESIGVDCQPPPLPPVQSPKPPSLIQAPETGDAGLLP